jgi:hypothetical protein
VQQHPANFYTLGFIRRKLTKSHARISASF